MQFQAGLPQGCPLSCFIFILCIDPLLVALSKVNGVRAVAGFVDDWSAACHGAVWAECLARYEVLIEIIEDFERASGSRINKGKSAVVPSRNLTPEEEAALRSIWPDIRVSRRERLLGLYIGLDATIDDQYRRPLEKLGTALEAFNSQRDKLSLAMRVVVVNVFM